METRSCCSDDSAKALDDCCFFRLDCVPARHEKHEKSKNSYNRTDRARFQPTEPTFSQLKYVLNPLTLPLPLSI